MNLHVNVILTICLLYQSTVLPEPVAVKIEDLSWLAGCWSGASGAREMTEHWMKPAGGTMLAVNRTVANGKTVAFEFIQLKQEEDGNIYYIARPSGQREASFKLVKSGEREAVFENPEHDFPQRIIYREKDGILLARIEGTRGGKERKVDFPMKRVPCE